MIKRRLLTLLLLGATIAVCACAGMQGLPQGSVLTGDYKGPFNGKFFWGSIEVKVYDAPGGSRPVFGRFQQQAEEGLLDFRGEVTGSRQEAQFTIADGSISGELSADGISMSGTYRLTDPPFDQGTWSAQKK
jgi:hypothetical protein